MQVSAQTARRRRCVYGALPVFIAFAATGLYSLRQTNEVWVRYNRFLRTAALIFFVGYVVLWIYTRARVLRGIPYLRRQLVRMITRRTTTTADSFSVLGDDHMSTVLYIIFVVAPVCLVLIHPLGRWLPPPPPAREVQQYIPTAFTLAGFAIHLVTVTLLVDVVYQLYRMGGDIISGRMPCKRRPSEGAGSSGEGERTTSGLEDRIGRVLAEAEGARRRRQAGSPRSADSDEDVEQGSSASKGGQEVSAPMPVPSASLPASVPPGQPTASHKQDQPARFAPLTQWTPPEEVQPQPQTAVQAATGVEAEAGTGSGARGGEVRVEDRLFEAAQRCKQAVQRHIHPYPWPRPLSACVLLLSLCLSLWGLVNGVQDPIVMRVEIPLPRLPPALDGFKIAMLADVHIGNTVGASALDKAVSTVLGLGADTVVIAGDLSDQAEGYIAPMLAPLRRLNATAGAAPVYWVSGNHDYYEGTIPGKRALFSSLGLIKLENDIVSLPAPGHPAWVRAAGASFDLLGVPDWEYGQMAGDWPRTDLPGAVVGRNASRELVVLAHQPGHVPQAVAAGAGLQLSGHVHCGQMVPLNLGAYIVFRPYFRGLQTAVASPVQAGSGAAQAAAAVGGTAGGSWRTWVWMSCGTFGWGPLMRQAAPQEITLVVLRSQAVVGTDAQPKVEKLCKGIACGE